MTPALQEVMEQAEKLDTPTQQALAEPLQLIVNAFQSLPKSHQEALVELFRQAVQGFIADARWEQLLSSPQGISAARGLARQAMADVEAGEVEEGGFAG